MQRILIVGSGIIGLAHATVALEKGYSVTVFERHSQPLGATVRNFGTIWPIGQPLGPKRDRALASGKRWKEMSQMAGFSCQHHGSLHAVYNDDAWKVLLEFTALEDNQPSTHSLVNPEDIVKLAPHVRQENLRGGLYSETEMAVIPGEATGRIIQWLQKEGVTFHFETPVTQVCDGAIITSGGDKHVFDRLLICNGDELRLLYPNQLREASVTRCKLQMLETAPQGDGWHLAPIVASELTLRHYASFKSCISLPQLQQRLKETWSDHENHGIHVLAVQRPTGELVLGDSHEYGADFSPRISEKINDLILEYLATFLDLQNPRITDRWNGYYLKTTSEETETILEPAEHVQIVTGLGGAGLTLSFGLAQDIIAGWS